MAELTKKSNETVNSVKSREDQIEEVDISPTGTVSATGEIAQGALGAFSFDELIGRETVGQKQEYTHRNK